MTILALHRGVRAQEREAVLVIFHLLDGDIPPLYGVASRAIRAHLSLVNIGMAVLTILSCVGEHGLDVALRASHFFVHATEGILGLVVVELRNGADGPPARSRVAVLARNRERPVRTASALSLGRSSGWLP